MCSHSLGDVVSVCSFSITFGSVYYHIMFISPSIGGVLKQVLSLCVTRGHVNVINVTVFSSTPGCRGLGMF